MSISVQFVTKRIDAAVLRGQKELTDGARKEYQEAAEEAAEWWGDRIRASGRGGQWNAQMSNINSQVTSPKSGGFFIRVGWFNPAGPRAEDNRTSWFVYQDTGYDLFGRGSTFIPGLMLQIDARQRLENEMRKANERIADRVEAAFRGK